ncbi:MAG: response regulator [Desulfobacterales bacterium]|nr:response regulator [Desulfobacterales bacterium]
MNLVSNAAEAQVSGGQIIISTNNQYIDKSAKGYKDLKQGDYVLLRVSDKGIGTDFYLYFPVTQKIAEKPVKTSLETNKGNFERILIIDDIPEQREMASKMLEKLNYSVAAVSSGEKGVEYIKNNKVDLIVLDMIMDPGIDGLETYKRILEHNPEQKAIIASGFSENDRVREAQRLGAGQYLKKPYTFEKIGLAVKKELQK